MIRFGQKLRIHGSDRRHLRWTHAALIVDRDGSLIEAVGTGVRRWHLDRYREDDYVVVRIHTSEENRDEVVHFAEWALERGSSYSRLSTVSIALSMLTGSRLTFFIDGQFVCSGLVARALERTEASSTATPPHRPGGPGEVLPRRRRSVTAASGRRREPASTARTSSARDRMPSLR